MNTTKRICTGLLAGVMTAALLLTGCEKEPQIASENWYYYDLSQYVTVPEYKGIEVEAYVPADIDAALEQQVLLARSNYAVMAEKQDAIVNGDQVNIDYAGYMDGVQFQGGTAAGADLNIGSGMFIDGFEEGLIGSKTGDTVTLDLHFPDPYPNNPAFSGKAVQFVVTVNAVYAQALPEYNDAFVKEHYNHETVASFEQELRAALIEQDERTRYNFVIQGIWKFLGENTEVISYPEAEYNKLYEEVITYYTSLAEQESMTLNEYVTNTYGISVSEFYNEIESSVKESMKQEMILYTIARAENITVSDEEYEARGAEYAAYYGLASLAELEQYYEPEYIRDSILFDLVDEFLCEYIVEVAKAE